MSTFFKNILLSVAAVVPIASSAAVFQNPIDNSGWVNNKSNLECRLSQSIPKLLHGNFIQRAGMPPMFEAQITRSRNSDKVSFYFSSPDWHINKINPVFIVDAKIENGTVRLGDRETRKIWDVLSAGYALEMNLPNGDIARINPTEFQQRYEEYISCVAQLLPNSYKQLEWSSFHYDGGGVSLSEADKQRLDLLVEFYKDTDLIDQFVVDGHSDSGGKMLINRDLSKKRAQLVVEYLEAKGIPPEIIEMRFHGQNYPIASNNTSEGRDINRRSTVRMYKKTVEGRKLIKDMDIYDQFVATRQIVGGKTPSIYADENMVHVAIEADQILQAVSADTEFQMLEKGLDINGEDGVAESLWSGERRVKGGIPKIVKGIETFNGINPDEYLTNEKGLRDAMKEKGLSQTVLVDERVKGENDVILQEGDGFTDKELDLLNKKSREGISVGKFNDIIVQDNKNEIDLIADDAKKDTGLYEEPNINEVKDLIGNFFEKKVNE